MTEQSQEDAGLSNPNREPTLRLFDKLKGTRDALHYSEGIDATTARNDFVHAAKDDSTSPDVGKALLVAYIDTTKEETNWMYDANIHAGRLIAVADVWLEAGYPKECFDRLWDIIEECSLDDPQFADARQAVREVIDKLEDLLYGQQPE